MIYLFYGEDQFSIHEELKKMRMKIGSDDLIDVNTTELNGSSINLTQILETSAVVPFLAERRLVLVRGFLKRLANKGEVDGDQDVNKDSMAHMLNQIPDTTILIFLEDSIRHNNPLVKSMGNQIEICAFPLLKGHDLMNWIRQRIVSSGATIKEPAVRLLADYVGGDLWAMNGEVEKLILYCRNQEINEDVIRLLISRSRETNIFDIVDAVLEGNTGRALFGIQKQLDEGGSISYIITMLARQIRLILSMKEIIRLRIPRTEWGSRLGLSAAFALRRTEEQAKKYNLEELTSMYRNLLETDLNIKRGYIPDRLSVDIFVAGLATRIPKA